MSSANLQGQVARLHNDRSGQIAAVISVMIGLATIAVVLRLFTRWLIATSWKLDDYGIIAALGLDYGLFITQIVGIQYGAGKHAADLNSETITQNLKVLMACELIYVTCLFAIKISILALYYRLFSTLSRKFNIAVYVVAGLTVVGWVIAFLIFAFQCKPFAYAFDKSIEGHCVDFNAICVVTSVINVIINIVLLILPLPVVWHLRVSRARKLAHIWNVLARWFVSYPILCGSIAIIHRLMFTISVVVVSIIRIPVSMAMSPTDITWTEYGVGTWSVVEVSIGIFSACLPVMRPLLRRFIRPTAVEESHSMQITCLPASSTGKTSPEQHRDPDSTTNPRQQQPCQHNNGTTKPAAPQRLNSNGSVMSVKQWRDPENMHPGDLWHVYNSSHGTAKAFRSEGVKSPTATTTTREVSYGIWPAD